MGTLQALCGFQHKVKTAREDGGIGCTGRAGSISSPEGKETGWVVRETRGRFQ